METYREIAEHYGLKGIVADRYVAYMMRRWTDTQQQKCEDGYASEWAERFKAGIEMGSSDNEGKKVLSEIDAGHYGRGWRFE